MRDRHISRGIKAYLCAIVVLTLFGVQSAAAVQQSDTVAPDSSNFVTASVVVSASSAALYSVFGHVTFRMECPTHQLDYIFTYESDTDIGNFMTFIAGKATAKYIAVPADTFIADAQALGRELRQYRLDLTPHEKQELWRQLDEDMMAGGYRHFNLLKSNCLSTTIEKIQACLVDDTFEWGEPHYPLTLCDGDLLRYHVRKSAWAEFIYITFAGTAYDGYSAQENRLSPDILVPLLREARFVDKQTGAKRPVITDEGITLVEERQHLAATPFSPMVVFGTLLALTLLLTFAEWRRKRYGRWARWFDALLLGALALIGLLLLYVTFSSELFGSRWNWYLILFNPLPLLVWLWQRRKRGGARFWAVYSGVLVLFICATPWLGVLDLPRQLITASVLTRSISHYFRIKQYQQENKHHD